jgi:hypothetical protein
MDFGLYYDGYERCLYYDRYVTDGTGSSAGLGVAKSRAGTAGIKPGVGLGKELMLAAFSCPLLYVSRKI